MNMTVLQDFKELPAAEAAPGKKKVHTKRKRINYFTCTLPAKSLNEGLARGIISSFCAQLDPTVEELCDMKTAISEAVTNCIVHAYPDHIGPVVMSIAVYPGREVHITVSDKGVGIPDIPQAMEPLFTTGNPEERSGLGFAVMQSFMDKVKVTSRPGKGTKVLLIKRLAQRE